MEDIDKNYLKDWIHKVSSPLTTVIGYSELLERKLSKEIADEKDLQWAKTIHSETLKIKEILEELSEKVRKP